MAAYISQIVLVKFPTIRSIVFVAYTLFSEEGNQLNFTALLHNPVRKTNTVDDTKEDIVYRPTVGGDQN